VEGEGRQGVLFVLDPGIRIRVCEGRRVSRRGTIYYYLLAPAPRTRDKNNLRFKCSNLYAIRPSIASRLRSNAESGGRP